MMCTLSVTMKSPWFDMASRLNQVTLARIYEDQGKKILVLYFQKSGIPREQISTILANKSAVDKAGYYSIVEGIKEADPINVLLDVLDVPSVLLCDFYIQGVNLFVSFRFHRSVLEEVNRVLLSLYEPKKRASIVYLGRSPGLVSIVKRISDDIPLSVVRVSIPPQQTNMSRGGESFPEIVAEGETRYMGSSAPRAVFYSGSKLGWARTISEEDGIYEASMDEPFSWGLTIHAYRARIPLVATFGKNVSDRIEITSILPSTEVQDYLDTFADSQGASGEPAGKLDLCIPFNEEVWNTI